MGPQGPAGETGPAGPVGATGPIGPQGEPGGTLGFADFYALMPPDNAAAVAPEIIGMAIVTTTVINSILTVRNPAGNAAALTITPVAGGTRAVSAHLVIIRIA